METIRLFVSVYRDQMPMLPEPLLPVSAGAALYPDGTPLLPVCDHRGDHISSLNPQYCELTVQYWAWKNADFDFGGLLHQRRYFDWSDPHPFACDQPKRHDRPYRIYDVPDEITLRKLGTEPSTILNLLRRYRMIAPLRENLRQSVASYYRKNDGGAYDDLGLLLEIIRERFPDYADSAAAYLRQSEAYFCNMFAADRELFEEYSRWLFDILAEYDKRKPHDKVAPREQGKLAERLFGIYMTHLRQNTDIPWAELPRAHFAGINGMTPHNLSFNRRWYALAPPGSRRRGWLRRLPR